MALLLSAIIPINATNKGHSPALAPWLPAYLPSHTGHRRRGSLALSKLSRRGFACHAIAIDASGAEHILPLLHFEGISLLLVDPWAPNAIDSQSIASQLFAASLFPYLGFLYHITRSKSSPKLTLFGFYFLLVFVFATIPAGIYAKVKYGTSLANVDWLHGSAESLLTLTNLFIVLGLRRALRESNESTTEGINVVEDEKI